MDGDTMGKTGSARRKWQMSDMQSLTSASKKVRFRASEFMAGSLHAAFDISPTRQVADTMSKTGRR